MTTPRLFTAPAAEPLWQQVTTDMAAQTDLLDYTALLDQAGHQVLLAIDIDPGGGFESGFATTTFSAAVPNTVALRFSLHEQGWAQEIGKLLGMEDAELGYPEIDEAFIVKTNDAPLLTQLLAAPELRIALLRHREGRLILERTDDTVPGLTLYFTQDAAVLESGQLQEIHALLLALLMQLVPTPVSKSVGAPL